MKYNRIIIIYKKSTFQMYGKIIKSNHLKKKNAVLYEAIVSAHKEHLASIKILKKQMKLVAGKVIFHCRGEKRMPKIFSDDLLIALGGDGTFIFASHFVQDATMLGINSAPDFSIGHYCRYNLFDKNLDLLEEIRKILSGQISETSLNRLKIWINGKAVEIPVINDLLIVDKNPATTTRYILKVNGKQYTQKSSGIWISTSMGSSAAYLSSGGNVFNQFNSKNEKQFGVRVREIYRPEKGTYLGGMVSEKDKFEIIISMIEGYIYIDGGQKKIQVNTGDKILIGFQEKPLKAILK